MRYIDKTDNEPLPFIAWKVDQNKELEKLYYTSATTGNQVWKHLDIERAIYNKNRLKEHLVKEQGYICCYCGSRIFNDLNTRIEHLLPKSIYKKETYNYNNLLASCQGGTKDIIHVLQKGETLEIVAERYGVHIEHIESVYVTSDYLLLFRKETDLEDLRIGDRILIFKKVDGPEQHCDNKKDSKEIDIHPLQKNCEEHFSYNKRTGDIYITDNNRDSITTLGLNNNPYLKENRLKVINEATRKLKFLIENFARNPILFKLKQQQLLQQLQTKDTNGHLRSWNFVESTVLQGK